MKTVFNRNTDGVRYIVARMSEVRKFDTWQDFLELSDDTVVLVHEDGSVNVAETGDAVCFDVDASGEAVDAWKRFWGFR